MLQTTFPACDDGPYRRVFKALLPFEKEEKKRVRVLFYISTYIYIYIYILAIVLVCAL